MKNELNEQKIFYCECCDYKCNKKSNFNRHLESVKHKKMENTILTTIKNEQNEQNELINKEFKCICGKSYKHYPSLWNHKLKCSYVEKEEEEEEKNRNNSNGISEEKIINLIQENNKDMMNAFISAQNGTLKELLPLIGNSTTNNSTTNNTINNNQHFNINVFLNEKCKDAINMSDFIKSIEVSLEQLDYTKTQGLEKGISNVIMENMNKLSVYERPIHCTDLKRETLYIKENDTWEKDKSKEKIKKAINKTSNKNYTALINWRDANPDWLENDDKGLYYAKAMSKIGKPIEDVDDKIVKKICNETYIKDIKDDIKYGNDIDE